MEGNLRTAVYLSVDAAIAFHQFMRNDDLRGEKIRVLNVIDHLRCRFNAKLHGIDVDRSQRR